MRKSRFLIALSLLLPLAACGGGEYVHPLDALKERGLIAARAGNNFVREAQNSVSCPTGMKPKAHTVDIENDSHFEYTEEHGRAGGGRGYNGRGSIHGGYATYSGADVQVELGTESASNGRVVCVPVINLTAE